MIESDFPKLDGQRLALLTRVNGFGKLEKMGKEIRVMSIAVCKVLMSNLIDHFNQATDTHIVLAVMLLCR